MKLPHLALPHSGPIGTAHNLRMVGNPSLIRYTTEKRKWQTFCCAALFSGPPVGPPEKSAAQQKVCHFRFSVVYRIREGLPTIRRLCAVPIGPECGNAKCGSFISMSAVAI